VVLLFKEPEPKETKLGTINCRENIYFFSSVGKIIAAFQVLYLDKKILIIREALLRLDGGLKKTPNDLLSMAG
jgi:hypothetical protein